MIALEVGVVLGPQQLEGLQILIGDPAALLEGRRAQGVEFMAPPPDTYYERLDGRLPGHGEPAAEIQARGILIDGSTAGGNPRILLQIFTQTLLGPLFFEIIQRKGDEGFGEGNFQALFESIERDQLARGVVGMTV